MNENLSPGSTAVERLDFARDFHGYLGATLYPIQKEREALKFVSEIETINPKRIVEIGTGNGGFALMMAAALADGGVLATVDLPNSEGGGPDWRDAVVAEIPCRGKVVPVRGNSHDIGTLDTVRSIIGGEIDVLFVDAEHTISAVSQDFVLWGPLVRSGGIVGFHDITTRDVGGFWLKFTRTHDGEFMEIVEDWKMVGFGIGVWWKP